MLSVLVTCLAYSCKEMDRFDVNSNDNTAPGQITYKYYKALYGGARFYYDVPSDEDLLQIQAEYTNEQGKKFTFSSSYLSDSVDVYGLPNTDAYRIQLYALDRSGNRSQPVQVIVEPLEPAFQRVAKSLQVKPGFGSFIVEWKNELQQNINVYVDFSFKDKSGNRTITSVFTSNLLNDRKMIQDLNLSEDQRVDVQVRVEDTYGNITNSYNKGAVDLLEDEKIPKANWSLPSVRDEIAGVGMAFGDDYEGRMVYVMDGVTDFVDTKNYLHTGGRGKTGFKIDGNMPWNIMIDLGDYYELSRIVTHQRHYSGATSSPVTRGQFYQGENVGQYRMYYLDEDTDEWVLINEHQIPVPQVSSELDYVKAGRAGDMAYMYPEEPKFTKKTRWFRYEAVFAFLNNYTSTNGNALSEITLFGRKAL